MGSLRKKTATKPLPDGAELFDRKGETFARWVDQNGKKRTAKTTTGRDGSTRIVVESGTYTAKYRQADGTVREVATGCRDRAAAQSILTQLERRQELVLAKVLTADEDAVADYQAVALADHFEVYLVNMRSRGLSNSHISEVTRYLNTLAEECRFGRLPDVTRSRFDRWLADRRS